MRFQPLAVLFLAGLATGAGEAQAAKVKVWYHYAPNHYEKARQTSVVVSNEGALRLSRQLKPLAKIEAAHVWDIVEDKDGNLYLGTGDEGKILKVTADGKVSVAFKSTDSQVLSLALASDGSIYAGTGPHGLVIRLGPDGAGKILYKSPEMYVWSLAVSADGQTVYAGTGPKGRIYAVTPEGKARVFYETKQEHILAMAMAAGGMLYAGTDKDGLVYRIDPKGKGFVLYSAPQSEVRSLLVTAQGVYAGTSSPTRRRNTPAGGPGMRGGPFSSPGGPGMSMGGASTKPGTGPAKAAVMPGSAGSSAGETVDRTFSILPSSPPSRGDNSLYRIGPDGGVREIFRDKVLLLTLLQQGHRLLVGTGMVGQLFEVNEDTKERTELARLDHGQIHCLFKRHDGSIVLGTGDPGKLYVLNDSYSTKGTLVSDVLDAKLISKWGALRWKADEPKGTHVTVSARSGNTPEPSETWSEWSPEQTDPERATIAAPPARFLQYRVTLTTEDPKQTPAVHNLALRYVNKNLAPEVTSIQVPDLDAANLELSKKIRLKWTATDPNEDDLTYTVFVRKEGWKNWVQLEENLERTDYEWDTTTTPSGAYQVKVAVSDSKDNSAEDALTAERTSTSFLVAHESPTVAIKTAGMEGEQAILEATAVDPLVRLTSASFSVNGKKWQNLFPTDGLFDSKTESFRFKTEALKPGTYVVVLRVRDAAGNTGSGDVVFTVKGK
jgi:hypothetical protein